MSRYVGAAEPHRFGFLLGTLFLVLLAIPLAEEVPAAELGVTAAFWGVLFAGVLAIARDHWLRSLALATALAKLLADVARELVPSAPAVVPVLASLLGAACLALVCTVLLRHILTRSEVSVDVLLGGVAVYLLLGVFFSYLFAVVELLAPGSLRAGGEPLATLNDAAAGLVYYSFVTLTTLGYGDVVPVSSVARMLAAVEAVVGQLYIAVFIAGMVGLHIAGRRG